MARRARRQAGWRVFAVVALLWALIATLPGTAQAASVLTITVTDEAGTPLAGAGFGVYPVIVDDLGSLVIPSGAEMLAGQFTTDATGVAVIPDLADGETYGIAQLGIPPGHTSDPGGDQFITTDPMSPTTLTFINPLATSTVDGTVVVAVTELTTEAALEGVTIQVQAIDPESGLPGEAVTAAVSDVAGEAIVEVPAGAWVVSVVAPGGYLPTDAQVVEVTDPAAGEPAADPVAFALQPDPVEPTLEPTVPVPPVTETPVPPVTETPVPPTEVPSAEVPPTATEEPTAPPAETGEASPPPETDPAVTPTETTSTFVPNQPATIAIDALVCTSDDPALIGTMVINRNTDLAPETSGIPANCRVAREDEFTFVFRDPRTDSPWDDLTLGRRDTDAAGLVSFTTPIAREGQSVYVAERLNPGVFSDTMPLVANGTINLRAIRVISAPQGDLTVRNTDAVTGSAVVGACYRIAAAGLESVPLAEACDADDGADGVVSFSSVDNGDYVVVPDSVPANYVFAPSTPVTVSADPLDITLAAAPYGTLQLQAQRCATVPTGLVLPAPEPGSGDGIDGLGDMTTETLPETDGEVVLSAFQVAGGQAGGGDGIGQSAATVPADCAVIAAGLEVVAPDGTVTPVTVDGDGVSAPLVLPPTDAGAPYVVRDLTSGMTVAIDLAPAGVTTVTLVELTSTEPSDEGQRPARAVGLVSTPRSDIG